MKTFLYLSDIHSNFEALNVRAAIVEYHPHLRKLC